LLFPLAFAACLAAGCSREHPTAQAKQETEPVVAVSAIQLQPEQIRRKVELVGTLEGEQEVTVSSEVAARVIEIHADLGDRVQRGQVLVQFDAREAQLTVERQNAALAQVLAQLGVSGPQESLPAAAQTSMVRKAAADLSEAESNFERTKALVAKGVAAKALLDSAEARYQVARANHTASLEQVRNLHAQAESLRAQLALAKKKVADSIVRAPFSGTLRSRFVEIGQYVREQGPIVSMASINPLKLRTNVPEKWYPFVAAGSVVELTVDAYSDVFRGRVSRVAGAVDPQSRTFMVEAQVDNSQGRLLPGLFARAVLTTSKTDAVLRAPANAVVSFYGVQKVYAIEKDRVSERVVKLGDRTGDRIEISEGLAPGVWIATTELAKLRQGSRVSVKRGM
jgi:multidrug efflux pump subunit AcrA (membrane-fusion protein)